MNQYNHLVFAGTFDRFHRGHEQMIDKAFVLAKQVSLGITTEKMYRTKILETEIQSYTQREKAVRAYLKKQNYLSRTHFFKLNDPLGTSVTDHTMDSILVSEETAKAARFINTIRKKRGLNQLVIHIMYHFLASDKKPITSERIRLGEIDREGNVYLDLFQKNVMLPDYLRKTLRVPLGKIMKGDEKELHKAAKKTIQDIKKKKPPMIIGVGDVVNASLVAEGFIPDVQIIDLRTRRKKIRIQKRVFRIQYGNKSGTIQKNSVTAIKRAIQASFSTEKKEIVVIRGEEDLLTLPAILLAPLGSLVLYGQYDLGIVMVFVDEAIKKQVIYFIKNFIPQE